MSNGKPLNWKTIIGAFFIFACLRSLVIDGANSSVAQMCGIIFIGIIGIYFIMWGRE